MKKRSFHNKLNEITPFHASTKIFSKNIISKNIKSNFFFKLCTLSYLLFFGIIILFTFFDTNSDISAEQINNTSFEKFFSSGDIILLDDDAPALIKLNPITGNLTLISGGLNSTSNILDSPQDIALDSEGNFVVIDQNSGCGVKKPEGAVIKIDYLTGDQFLISDNCISQLGLFRDLESIVVDSDDNIIVLDEKSGSSLVILVNPDTGNQTLIYNSEIFYSNQDIDFEAITLDKQGYIILTGKINNEGAVVRVNPNTGSHTIVSNNKISQPGLLVTPIDVVVDDEGNFFVIDLNVGPSAKTGGVIKIDPFTGTQSLISENWIENITSELLYDLEGLAMDPDGNILVADDHKDRVIRINSKTGNQTLIFEGANSSNGILEDLENLLVINPNNKKTLLVNLAQNIPLVPDLPLNLESNLVPVESYEKAYEVHLNWEAPKSDGGAPIIWYEIERSEGTAEDGFGNYSFYARTDDTSFVDPVGFTILKYHYSYRVSAANIVGQSEPSNQIFATLYGDSPFPPIKQGSFGLKIEIEDDDGLEGGDCSIIGDWNKTTKTCVFTTNPKFGQFIEIGSNDITINCNGHVINGNGSPENGITINGKGVTVKNCHVTHFQNGIFLDHANSNTLKGNKVMKNKNNGIQLFESYDNTLIGNTSYGNKKGIDLTSSDRNVLNVNIVNQNIDDGIQLSESDNNTLIGNTSYGNKDDGIDLDFSNNNILRENFASDNKQEGIALFKSYGNVLEYNISNGNKDDGIDLTESDRNILNVNIVNQNMDDGIDLDNSNENILNANVVNGNAKDGIDFTRSNDNKLINNISNGNNDDGIKLDSSNNNILSGNNANYNSDVGITLGKSSNSNTLNGNNSSDNSDGFEVIASNENTLNGNFANYNDNRGIFLRHSESNVLNGNFFYGNGQEGLGVSGPTNNIFNGNIVD